MVYRSLTSPENQNYRYDVKIAHLYGNLMNTYGDNGNVLMLKYVAEKLGARVEVDIVSLEDDFDKDSYDIILFGLWDRPCQIDHFYPISNSRVV